MERLLWREPKEKNPKPKTAHHHCRDLASHDNNHWKWMKERKTMFLFSSQMPQRQGKGWRTECSTYVFCLAGQLKHIRLICLYPLYPFFPNFDIHVWNPFVFWMELLWLQFPISHQKAADPWASLKSRIPGETPVYLQTPSGWPAKRNEKGSTFVSPLSVGGGSTSLQAGPHSSTLVVFGKQLLNFLWDSAQFLLKPRGHEPQCTNSC